MNKEEQNKNATNNSKRPKSQKIVLIGDSNVGKTSIIDQFISIYEKRSLIIKK